MPHAAQRGALRREGVHEVEQGSLPRRVIEWPRAADAPLWLAHVHLSGVLHQQHGGVCGDAFERLLRVRGEDVRRGGGRVVEEAISRCHLRVLAAAGLRDADTGGLAHRRQQYAQPVIKPCVTASCLRTLCPGPWGHLGFRFHLLIFPGFQRGHKLI